MSSIISRNKKREKERKGEDFETTWAKLEKEKKNSSLSLSMAQMFMNQRARQNSRH